MQVSVKILDIVPVTHNVRHYRVERPRGYGFAPGQATEVSIDRDGWRDEKPPSPSPVSPMPTRSNSPSRAISTTRGSPTSCGRWARAIT